MGLSDWIGDLGLFQDWSMGAWITWLIITLGIVMVSWFIKIPSAAGGEGGFPFLYSVVFTIVLPIAAYYFLDDPERIPARMRGKK